MPLTLHPLSAADIPHLSTIYTSAFSAEPLSLRLFPRSGPHLSDWWTTTNTFDYGTQATAHFLKVVDEESASHPIVAYAKWHVPLQRADGSWELGGDDAAEVAETAWPANADVQLAERFFGALARRREEILGDRPHVYLEILATLPEFQCQGAAGQLLRWGLRRADELRLETYLESSPRALRMYERFGFEVVGSLEVQEVRHVESFMLRPARGSGGVEGGGGG